MSQHPETGTASPEEIRVADTVTRWLTHLKAEYNLFSIGTIPSFGEANLSQAAEGVLQALSVGWIYFQIADPGLNVPAVKALTYKFDVPHPLKRDLHEVKALALSVRSDVNLALLLREGNYALVKLFRDHMELPFIREEGTYGLLQRVCPLDMKLDNLKWQRFPLPGNSK